MKQGRLCVWFVVLLILSACSNEHRRPEPVAYDAKAQRKIAQALWGGEGVAAEMVNLTDSAKRGRLIWYNSTAGNSRFHAYVFPQRITGRAFAWYKFLRSDERKKRFDNWGLINDPGCCTPGTSGCDSKGLTLQDTYGMDYCQGDETLLPLVGVKGNQWMEQKLDPACYLMNASSDEEQKRLCDLEFGLSTGALGFRKFPNPRFNRDRWLALNGSLSSWEGAERRSDDGSIEPPFLIGTTCGSCHIAFNPLKPPENPNNPGWENILGTIGNQYLKNGVIFGSGFITGQSQSALEWQVFTKERYGATDTSANPNDQIANPGTMNAIINLPQRPQEFLEQVDTWRPTQSCGANDANCRCEANMPGKCWKKSLKQDKVFHILKGGEDSIGAAGAVQRVYINIGSCSEQCWLNHLTDFRVLDPKARNYGQTPFDIGQCRRDCPNFRAVEDRVGDVYNFLASARQMDLKDAIADGNYNKLVKTIAKTQGVSVDDVDAGREIFRNNCARCHSSIKDSVTGTSTFQELASNGMRADWLGNDELTHVTEVQTNMCRPLHTNHARGHVWEQYGSKDLRQRGRGYLRNISLLSLWTSAPFMHNNGIGPEICPKTSEGLKFFDSPYDSGDKTCVPYPVSVDERLNAFKLSVAEMLTPPDQRVPKITRLDQDILLPLIPILDLNLMRPSSLTDAKGVFYLKVKKGTPQMQLGSYRHKEFVQDMIAVMLAQGDKEKARKVVENRLRKRDNVFPASARSYAVSKLKNYTADEILAGFDQTLAHFGKSYSTGVLEADPGLLEMYMNVYSNCPLEAENKGHPFGTELPDDQKKQLTAFLMTL